VSSSLGRLRRSIALLRLADVAGSADLKTELDRLGTAPAPGAVADLASRVRHTARRKLAEAYASADPARQAFMGWMVDPEDVPAYPQPGSSGPPNAEFLDRRGAEKAFHDWLAKDRYGAEAAFLNGLEWPSALDAANDFREIARAYADAFR
jgi:hypothetical protein